MLKPYEEPTTAEFLRAVMEQLHISSQRELGVLLGVTEDNISRYMSGDRTPNFDTCVTIQVHLNKLGIIAGLAEIRGRKI